MIAGTGKERKTRKGRRESEQIPLQVLKACTELKTKAIQKRKF